MLVSLDYRRMGRLFGQVLLADARFYGVFMVAIIMVHLFSSSTASVLYPYANQMMDGFMNATALHFLIVLVAVNLATTACVALVRAWLFAPGFHLRRYMMTKRRGLYRLHLSLLSKVVLVLGLLAVLAGLSSWLTGPSQAVLLCGIAKDSGVLLLLSLVLGVMIQFVSVQVLNGIERLCRQIKPRSRGSINNG